VTPARRRRRPDRDTPGASEDSAESADSTNAPTSDEQPDSEGPQAHATLPADDLAARQDRARRLQATIDDLIAGVTPPTPASPRDVTNASAADEARAAAETSRPQDGRKAPKRAHGETPGTR
jgi:hypothetical protein